MRLASVLMALSLLSAWPSHAQDAEPVIVAEARTFMATYAEDLRAGDRAKIVARYAPPAWLARAGRVEVADQASLARGYGEGSWSAPAAFDWIDLNYAPSGPETVSVIGRFRWTGGNGQSVLMSYHGLLVRTDEGLRIKVEDETPVAER